MLIAIELALLALLALAYALRVRTLRKAGEAPPRSKVARFAAGVLLVAAAVASLSHLSSELLFARTAQLLLIGDLGALLVVLGLTSAILAPLSSRPAIRPLRHLANPLLALPLWALVTMLCYWPSAVDLAQHSEPFALLLHVLCFAVGVLAWSALLGPSPRPRWFTTAPVIAYVVLWGLLYCALGAVGVWVPWVFYHRYTSIEVSKAVSPLADQGIAGSILIAAGAIGAIAVLLWLYLSAGANAEEAEGPLVEPVGASANAASNSS
jgi:cytochrome c oxidase assembly factor CtaG